MLGDVIELSVVVRDLDATDDFPTPTLLTLVPGVLRLRYGVVSTVGNYREQNEDNYYVPGRNLGRAPDGSTLIEPDRGSGRREGWLSNHHLAVRHDEGGWAPVGKTFKGLTDAEHVAMTARLRALEISDDGYTVVVRPEIVVEVAYEGIQKSAHLSSGYALRFARITHIRDDKRPEDATTLSELRARVERQATGSSGPGEGEW